MISLCGFWDVRKWAVRLERKLSGRDILWEFWFSLSLAFQARLGRFFGGKLKAPPLLLNLNRLLTSLVLFVDLPCNSFG